MYIFITCADARDGVHNAYRHALRKAEMRARAARGSFVAEGPVPGCVDDVWVVSRAAVRHQKQPD
jgi:hypothetical protein